MPAHIVVAENDADMVSDLADIVRWPGPKASLFSHSREPPPKLAALSVRATFSYERGAPATRTWESWSRRLSVAPGCAFATGQREGVTLSGCEKTRSFLEVSRAGRCFGGKSRLKVRQ